MARVKLPTFAIRARRGPRQVRLRSIAGRARRGGFSVVRQWGGPVILGFLLSRAVLIGGIYPFGPGLFVALRGANSPYVLAVGLGMILGAVRPEAPGALPRVVATLAAVQMAFHYLRLTRRLKSPVLLGAVTSVLVASVGLLWAVAAGDGTLEILRVGFEALAAGISCMVFSEAVVLSGILSGKARVETPGFYGQMGLASLGAAAFIGLKGMIAGPVSLQGCLSHLLIMTFSLWGSAGLGAASGVAVGSLGVLGGSHGLESVAFYAFPGLLGGVLRGWGKHACLAGYLTGALLMGVSLDSLTLSSLLAETGMAVVLVTLVPEGWLKRIAGGVTEGFAREDRTSRELAGERLEELAVAFSEVAVTFQETAPAHYEEEDQNLPQLFSGIVTRVCGSCPRYRRCWERDFHTTYNEVMEVFSRIDARGVPDADKVPSSLRSRCDRVDKMVGSAKELYEVHRLNRYWQRRLIESRELVCHQLSGITKILQGLSSDLRSGNIRVPNGEPQARLLAYEVGIARKPTGEVSGDHYLARELDAERLLLVLSDGMGVGRRAYVESHATVVLLEKLLASGFEKNVALKTVNSILLLRSPEEVFATVDMVLVNLRNGCADFVKVGAAPSYRLRQGTVTTVKAQGLPLGILSDVMAEPASDALLPGDVLVMATDGLTESGSAEEQEWIREFLEDCPDAEASIVAEMLVKAAINKRNETRADDITVLVTRFLAE